MTQVVTKFLSSVITILGVLVMMFVLNTYLALVTCATIPLILIATKIVGKRMGDSFKAQQKLLGEINGQIEENISGLKVVKLFRREDIALDELEKNNRLLRNATTRAQALAGLMGPLMNMTNNLRYAIVAVAGGILSVYNHVSIGGIAAFLAYTRQFGRPMSEIAQLYNSIMSALAGAERVFEVMDRQPDIVSAEDAVVLQNVRGDVRFRNVSFSYDGKKQVLSNISLTAEPGATVALVGPTGAGKTTIINLLTRFYDIQQGEILIDGRNIREYTLNSLRKETALVLQDTFLFSGTVMDNIRYGNPEADDIRVHEAAKASRADHFIRHLPEGYNTLLSEDGGNLSQGQRQLIAIARAILANPSILILDEATSSVDTRTELLIQEGMLHLMDGRTSFVIAHRLSTIRDADLILVLKDGEIIERGNHRELIEKNGFYAQLHSTHFETEIQ